MSTKYTFIAEEENGKIIKHTFSDSSGMWGTPVYEFFLFLKGTGFIFNIEEDLAIVNHETGEIRESLF